MPGDPKECREHAKRCWALASEVTNPALKESLVETAQRWSRLATDPEAMHILLTALGVLSTLFGITGPVIYSFT